jgi:hypothetical protein
MSNSTYVYVAALVNTYIFKQFVHLLVADVVVDDHYRWVDLDHEQLYLFGRQTQNDEQQRENEFEDVHWKLVDDCQ